MRAVDALLVEHRGEVVEDRGDPHRLGRKVAPGVVAAGTSDAAMLDHDDVESAARRAPAESPVGQDGCQPRPARDDQRRCRRARTGADVAQLERRRPVRCRAPQHPDVLSHPCTLPPRPRAPHEAALRTPHEA